MFDKRQPLTGATRAPTIGWMSPNPPRSLASLLAAVLAVAFVGVTAGHHGGRGIGSLFNCDRPGIFPPRCTSVADDLRHQVLFDTTLTEGLVASLRDTILEDYGPTDLAVTVAAELTSDTDVIAYSQDYGDIGAAAWVYCPSESPQGLNSEGDRWCRMQELHFNLNSRFAAFFEDDGSRDHVACHELGHTVGLRHWGNPPESVGPSAATCMNANTPNGPTELHPIDVDHINAYHYVAPPPSRRMELVSGTEDVAGQIGAAGVEALEVERHASLRELTRAADAVVRATVAAVEPGRTFGDPAGMSLHYAAVSLRVGEVLAGSVGPPDGTHLVLEVPLFDGPEAIGSLEESLIGRDAIYFLRNKGESARAAGLSLAEQREEAAYYRLVVFGSVVGNDAGAAAAGEDESGALAALRAVSFADALERVREAAR